MDKDTRFNVALNAAGEGLWGLQAQLILPSTVLVVLLEFFGADRQMLGSIPAIEAAAMMLPQLVGVALFRSRHNLKWRLIRWHCVPMIPTLPMVGALVLLRERLGLPDIFMRWMLVVAYGWFAFTIGSIVGVWFDWIAHLFDRSIRGTAMGVAFCVSQGMGALGAVAAWRMIAGLGTPTAQGWLYVMAGVFALISILMFGLMRDPFDHGAAERIAWKEIRARIWGSLGHRNFRRYLVARILTVMGFCILPLITVWFMSEAGGGVKGAMVVAAGGVMAVANAGSNLGFGWLGDRRGHRLGMIAGLVCYAGAIGVALTVAGAWGCFVTFALAGIGNGASFMAHNNLLFETCPHDHRLAHITAGNLAIAPWAIVAPLVWGQVAERAGMRWVFAVSLGFVVAGLVWTVVVVRDPREAELADGMAG